MENIEHGTSNTEQERSIGYSESVDSADHVEDRVFDLEDRLLDYAAAVIPLVEDLPKTRAGNHIAGQLLRSGTAPLPNHVEAESAESHADFIHKLKVCLKELRETRRWLRLLQRLSPPLATDSLIAETTELIRIFVASIRTALRNSTSK
jgi:four helix bundle protein